MKIVNILLITAYQLLVMSFAQYSIWIVKRAYDKKKTNPSLTTILVSSIAVSLLLLFVTFSNIITLFTGFELLEQKVYEYISILYGVSFIAILSAAIYFVTGDYVLSNNMKFQRITIKIATAIIIAIAILFVYSIIIANNETGANYVEVGNNYFLPIFTLILIIPLIVNTIQKQSIKAIGNTRSMIIISAIILSLVDLIFISSSSIQLSILFYAVYTSYVYKQMYMDSMNSVQNKEKHYTKAEFMVEYSLSERELEVIELVCKGQTNNEIAMNLILSPHTVKSHLKRIFTKLSIDSRHKLLSIFSKVNFDNN